MTILSSLDDNMYVTVRDGVEFYYFGEGCIADYYSNTIGYIDEIDIIIISFCRGENTKEVIMRKLERDLNIAKTEVSTRLNRLFKKGIIVFHKNPHEEVVVYHGVKGAYFPKEIVIELTNTCNYKCPFCYKNALAKGNFILDEQVMELEKQLHNNVKNILLTGGEPTLHPNYLKYIDVFSEYANVHMISNGSILYNHDANVLRKLKLIQFSMYGCNDDEYKKMTGCANGFSRLCKSIEFTKRNQIDTKIAVTLCDSTVDHIEQFVEKAIDFEISTLVIGIADVFGRGKYLYKSSNDFVKKREKALDEILGLKRKYRNKIKFELPNINISHIEKHQDIYDNVYRGSLMCGCGSEYLVVSHAGKIRACQMLPEARFSISEKNAFKEHICGNFHIKQLREATEKYYIENDFIAKGISPCQALDVLMGLEEG